MSKKNKYLTIGLFVISIVIVGIIIFSANNAVIETRKVYKICLTRGAGTTCKSTHCWWVDEYNRPVDIQNEGLEEKLTIEKSYAKKFPKTDSTHPQDKEAPKRLWGQHIL